MKILLTAFLITALASCSNGPREVVVASHPNGKPMIVKVYGDKAQTKLLRELHYFDDGQERVVREFSEDEADTNCIRETHYYKGKKLKLQGNYYEGKRTRQWVAWFENGNKWSQGKYIDGREDSTYTVWHPNGQVYYKGDFKNGERTGVWRFFNESGTLEKEINYDER